MSQTQIAAPDHTIPADAPGVCPVCGARALLPEGASSALVAVCDVLVIKALEKIGKWLTRDNRSGYHVLGGRPWHVAHTIWQPTDATVTKILRGAWDVVPALLDTHGCCGVTSLQVTQMLDSYVHDLTLTGTEHDFKQLSYRFESRLGLPVYPSHAHGSHHG